MKADRPLRPVATIEINGKRRCTVPLPAIALAVRSRRHLGENALDVEITPSRWLRPAVKAIAFCAYVVAVLLAPFGGSVSVEISTT